VNFKFLLDDFFFFRYFVAVLYMNKSVLADGRGRVEKVSPDELFIIFIINLKVKEIREETKLKFEKK
jgi:hypothetical protein